MGFLDWLAEAITLPQQRASTALTAKAQNRPHVGYVQGAQDVTRQTEKDYLDAYADRAWVYACMSSIAEALTLAPLRLVMESTTNDDTEIDEHPLLDLWKRPNPLTNGILFREQYQLDKDATGNFFAEIVYGANSQPVELWRLDPTRVSIVVDPADGLIAGYLFDPGNAAKKVPLDPHQIWHSRYTNPYDDYRGMSPLSAARDAIIFDYNANRQVNAFFANGLRVSGVLTGPQTADPMEISLAEMLLNRRHRGNSGSRALVLKGDWNYQDLSSTPKDADWIQGAYKSREEICAVLNVPPVVAGDFLRATYSNYDTALKDFWTGNIAGKYRRLDAELETYLLPLFYPDGRVPPGLCARHDLRATPAMMEDADAAMTRAVAGFQGGVLTLNEARSTIGQDALDVDVRRVPIAITEEIPGESPDVVDDITDDAKDGKQATRPLRVFEAQRARRLESVIEHARKIIRSSVRRQEDRLLAHITEHTTSRDTTNEVMRAVLSFSWVKEEASWVKGLRAAHTVAVEEAWHAASDAGVGAAYSLSNPLVVHRLMLLRDRPDGIKLLTGQIKEAVVSEVKRGIDLGATPHTIIYGGRVGPVPPPDQADTRPLMDGITGVYQPWAGEQDWKAERIARTETGVAYNSSTVDAYRDGGVSYVLVYDGDYDGECADADGQVWTLDYAEANPLEHPNCVRAFGPVTDENAKPDQGTSTPPTGQENTDA